MAKSSGPLGALVMAGAMLLTACGSEMGSDGPVSLPIVEGEAWELFWFSDSTGWGVADLWATSIEEDFGVEVEVEDYALGSFPAAKLLGWIGEGPSSLPELRDRISGAEIIVVNGNPRESGYTADIETCVSTSTESRPPPTESTEEDWAPYREVLEAIYENVFDLLDGHEAVVVAYDYYNPVIADWRAAGIEEGCAASWTMMNQTVRQAAATYNVPIVPIHEVFNGRYGTDDPRKKGYISIDGEHTSDQGKAAIVGALVDSGVIQINGN